MSVTTKKNAPGAKKETRVICGKTFVDWHNAIVYVHNKLDPLSLPTHMHFTFHGRGEALAAEVIQFLKQWTHYNKARCEYAYTSDTHEYRRARQMALRVLETHRRQYLAKTGSPPNPLGMLLPIDEALIEQRTNYINLKARERITGQTELSL